MSRIITKTFKQNYPISTRQAYVGHHKVKIINLALLAMLGAVWISGCSMLVTPEQSPWLPGFIESIADEPYYALAEIRSYEWRGQIYFEVTNPISSCAYCEVYTFNGKKVEWVPGLSQEDYVQQRQGGRIIWQARP